MRQRNTEFHRQAWAVALLVHLGTRVGQELFWLQNSQCAPRSLQDWMPFCHFLAAAQLKSPANLAALAGILQQLALLRYQTTYWLFSWLAG